MPGQNVHHTTCLITAGLLAACGIVQGPRTFQMAVGAALGVFVHPDWDYAEIRGVVKDLGPLKYLVKPYGLLVPHRSWISHSPLLGTAGRLLYILIPLWLVGQICFDLKYCSTNWTSWFLRQESFRWIAMGLALVDTIHILMDTVTTGFKSFCSQLFGR